MTHAQARFIASFCAARVAKGQRLDEAMILLALEDYGTRTRLVNNFQRRVAFVAQQEE